MAASPPNPPTGNSPRLHSALSVVVEFLPIVGTVVGGMVGGVAGTIFLDWAFGLVCALAGIAVGFVLGLVLQLMCSVFFVWGNVLKEAIFARNHVPLMCGSAAAMFAVVSILLDGAGKDFGLLAFAIVAAFTLGAALGSVAQGFVRWVIRHFRLSA